MKLKNLTNFELNKKRPFLPLDLQFFNDGGDGSGADSGAAAGGEGGGGSAGTEPLTLTPEELQARIDSETDKKVAKALETSRKKWEQEFSEKLEKEKKEAERLAKLSQKEREEAEIQKQREELEQLKNELAAKELYADAVAVLKEKELPANFADFLVQEDAEKTLKNINNFKEAVDKFIEQGVNNALKGEPPATSHKPTGSSSGQTSLREKARANRIIGK